VAAELVRRHGCRVTGVDQSPDMLAEAGRNLRRRGLAGRIALRRAQAERLPFPDASFDGLTFTYLLRYVDDPGATLSELARVVRPGGVVASLEFGVPPNRAARVGWRAYLAATPVLARPMSGQWSSAMRFLGTSVPGFWERYPLPRLLDLHERAGLCDLRVRRLTLGAAVVIWGVRAA
jgi:demethylmenaquinone methyltransferase / 2-methoxy-6-polyprenyl-1,4-benzoquinol methylase